MVGQNGWGWTTLTEKRLSYDFHAPKFVLSEDRKEAVLFGGSALEVESKSLLVKLIVDQEFLLDEVVPESDLGIPATGGDSGSPQPASIPDGSITIAKLSEKVIEELRKTITKEMLSTQILADLNRTITLQNLDSNVVELLNQTITRDMLDPEILNEISSTQKIVGTSNDPYQEGLAAYLRPMLTGGIWHSWGVSGMPVTLRSPSVDGRFLNYQWYKNGEAIEGANSEEYTISEFDPDQDAGEYEIQVSNAYATLKTKAVLNTGVGIGVGIGGSGDFMSEINSIRMKSDGSLHGAGTNYFIGDGSRERKLSPTQSRFSDGNLSINFKYLAVSRQSALYIRTDGSVFGIGGNPFGQLGLGNSSSVDYLTPIPNLNGAVHISLGFDHASFIKSDGTLWSVGRNHYGQLGIGSTDNKLVPTEVSGVDNAYVVSSGDYHTMIIKNDGTLWGMGRNNNGQLGDGTTTQKTSPVQVPNASDVMQVSSGSSHTMFIKNGGTLWGTAETTMGNLEMVRQPKRQLLSKYQILVM